MPLRILESPEPLSENSFSIARDAREPILIGSDAARLLANELRQYCAGEITGRSFLIAGHRGSGKTTLVAKAFLEIWKESERGTGIRRPLLVALNGPSLFSMPQSAGAPAQDSGAGTAVVAPRAASTAEKDTPEQEDAVSATAAQRPVKTEVQRVLEQIILALHRATAREFSDRFRSRARELAEQPGEQELAELAAQFDADLMECPEGERLRSYFARVTGTDAGKTLSSGVLGRNGVGSASMQAAAELLALSSISDAYKRISGEYARTDKTTSELVRTLETQLGQNTASKEYLTAILPLITGGVAGVGAHAAGSGGLTATVSGVLAAFAAVVILNYTSKRTTSRSRAESFIFDLSLATLDRAIPVLIRRLWHAGLAPIFVVDELDKVDDLEARMAQVVHHLKKLVAESAFFCFLTDREYFEAMLRESSNRAYPKEYTYYSRRVFSVLQAHDFADYLKRLIPDPAATATARAPSSTISPPAPSRPVTPSPKITPAPTPKPDSSARASTDPITGQPAQPPQPPAAAVSTAQPATNQPPPELPPSNPTASGPVDSSQAATTAPPTSPTGPQTATAPRQAGAAIAGQVLASGSAATEGTVRELLIWILRHRSQLHPLDLQRQITALVGDGGYINLTPQDVQRPIYLIDITLQVLIEALLNDEEVRYMITGKNEDLRLVHDALYYITREWLGGTDKLEINSTGEQRFVEYLENRTGIAKKDVAKKGNAEGADAVPPQTSPDVPPVEGGRPEYDKSSLFRIVRRLAEALADTDLAPNSPAGQLIFKWEETVRGLDPLARPPIPQEVKTAMLTGINSVLEVEERKPAAEGQPLESVVYRWRYRPSGAPRKPKAPLLYQKIAVTPASATMAGTAPTIAVSTPTIPTPTEQFSKLQSFMQMLNRAIGAPEDSLPVLRYDLLADRFRLLPTSPPWQAVEAAGKRFIAAAHADPVQRDLDAGLISDFANNVRLATQNMVYALSCAALIGSAVQDAKPYERVLLGLDVLTRALRLQQKNDPTPDLKKLVQDFEPTFGTNLSPSQLTLPDTASDESIETALTSYLELAHGVSPSAAERLQTLRQSAWTSARERLAAYALGSPSPEPNMAEMFCAAVNAGPALIPFDLSQLTAAHLTHLLVQALATRHARAESATGDDVPGWVAILSMHLLGFGSFNPSDLNDLILLLGGEDPAAQKELQALYGRGLLANRRAAASTIVFITRPRDSIATWSLRSDHLLLAGTPTEYLELLKVPLDRFMGEGPRAIAIEMDAAGELPKELQSKGAKPALVTRMRMEWNMVDAPEVYVYPQSPPKRATRDWATLVAPKGPEEIMSLARRMPSMSRERAT